MATATAVAMAALLLPVPETFVIEQPEPAVQEAPPEPAAKRPSRPQQKLSLIHISEPTRPY